MVNGEPETHSELARRVEKQDKAIRAQWREIGDMNKEISSVRSCVNTLVYQGKEVHGDLQEINSTLQSIQRDLGGKMDRPLQGLDPGMQRMIGASRALRWGIGTLIALGTMLAMWWDTIVEVIRATLRLKGG